MTSPNQIEKKGSQTQVKTPGSKTCRLPLLLVGHNLNDIKGIICWNYHSGQYLIERLMIVIVRSELSALNPTMNKGSSYLPLAFLTLSVNKMNAACVLKSHPHVFALLIELKYPVWNILRWIPALKTVCLISTWNYVYIFPKT